MLRHRLWRALRGRWLRLLRRALSATPRQDAVDAPADRRRDAQAHFWAELREGQREAEARAAQLRR